MEWELFYKNDGDLKAVYNIVVGTNSKVGKGILYTDFTTRIFFNQCALWFRLDFKIWIDSLN
jgi:hypothetical protein